MRKISILLPLIFVIIFGFTIKNCDAQTPKEIIISGRILNFTPKDKQIRIIATRLGVESERYFTELNHEGIFNVKFKSYISGDVRFTHNNANFLFIAHPGDSIYIRLDDKNKNEVLKTVEFSGDNAKTNQKILKFQVATNFNSIGYSSEIDSAKKTLNISEFSKFMEGINELQITRYNDFKKNEKPGNEALNWALIYAQEPYNYSMNWYPTEHSTSNKLTNWRVPLTFYDYQKTNLPIKKEHLISTYQLGMFANQYLFGYIQNHIYDENEEILDSKVETVNQDSLWINGIIKYTEDPLLRQLVLTERLSIDLDKKKISTFENYQKIILKTITEPFLLKPLQEKFRLVKEQIENPEISSKAILKDIRGTQVQAARTYSVARARVLGTTD